MSRKRIWLCILATLFLSTGARSQGSSSVTKVGITAAPFLEIGVGAKAYGMGGAFVGTANDASALYWNPSGMARLPRSEGSFVHIDWLADINFDFIGFVLPAGRIGSFGLSITSLSMDDMLVRTEDRPTGTGEYFKTGSMAIGASYAINLTDRFSIGFTGKYLREQIWKETATGIAFDIGTLFTTNFHGMRIGATLSNFGMDMRMAGEDLLVYHDIDQTQMGNNDKIFAELQTESWPLPLTFQVGVAMEIIQSGVNRLTLALDAVQPTDNTESINLGTEYALREWVFLRAGYRNLFLKDSEEGLTFGAGAILRFGTMKLKVDYSYAQFGVFNDIQCFAIGIVL
ncbi:PorV/PorQ family protein [candidate division KSB1 bacterium]|nr:PorV/PorQ family protein [candidate division KSB1 bacterium]RQW01632.1 MAG: PorV/PorQ family protein [candidate division KSB1 bacterium]